MLLTDRAPDLCPACRQVTGVLHQHVPSRDCLSYPSTHCTERHGSCSSCFAHTLRHSKHPNAVETCERLVMQTTRTQPGAAHCSRSLAHSFPLCLPTRRLRLGTVAAGIFAFTVGSFITVALRGTGLITPVVARLIYALSRWSGVAYLAQASGISTVCHAALVAAEDVLSSSSQALQILLGGAQHASHTFIAHW